MSEHRTGAHTITEEKIIFIQGNIQIFGRQLTASQKPQKGRQGYKWHRIKKHKKDNQRIILWESCNHAIKKEQTLGQVFCSAVPKEEKQSGLLIFNMLLDSEICCLLPIWNLQR